MAEGIGGQDPARGGCQFCHTLGEARPGASGAAGGQVSARGRGGVIVRRPFRAGATEAVNPVFGDWIEAFGPGSQITGTAIEIPTFLSEDEARSSLSEQVGAAYNLDDVPTNIGRLAGNLASEPPAERGFNLFDHLTADEMPYAERYAHVDSQSELAMVRRQRDQERKWQRELASGPLNPMLAGALAALGDPTTYLSFGAGSIVKGTRLARSAKLGAHVGTQVGVSEAILQATQQTRTLEESVSAILMSSALGFGLGGLGLTPASRALLRDEYGGLGPREAKAAEGELATMIRDAQAASEGPAAVSAAPTRTLYDPEDTKLADNFRVAEFQAKLGGAVENAAGAKVLMAPVMELMHSSSNTARVAAMEMSDVSMFTKGSIKGVKMPQALDIEIRGDQETAVGHLYENTALAHKEYRAAGGDLPYQQFREAVGKAIRFPGRFRDQKAGGHIQAAAEGYIKAVLEPLAREALAKIPDFKLIPEKLGWRYLTRVYRKDRIMADLHEGKSWRQTVAKWLEDTGQVEDAAAARTLTDAITDNILSNSANRVDLVRIPPVQRGPTKERVFDIPDELIEPWLHSDVLMVGSRYIRSLTADLAYARRFGNLDPFAEWQPKILEDYREVLEAAKPEQRKAITDKMKREMDTLRILSDRVRGILPPTLQGIYGNGSRIARNISTTRALGSVVVSSLPDPAKIAMTEGVARLWGSLFSQMAQSAEWKGLAKRDAREMGAAWDVTLNSRARALYDLDDTLEGQGRLDRAARFTDRAANAFMLATGLPHWNAFWKTHASLMASTRILQNAERVAAGKEIPRRERALLARAGLDDTDLRAFFAENEKWQRADVLRLGNIGEWGNKDAARKFRNAVLRDVDDGVVTPGEGDVPLSWSGSTTGRLLTQFKRFSMASNHKTLIPALQLRDRTTLGALGNMVVLGAMATALKDIVIKGEIRERTPRQWAGDAIDRSGVLSMYFELEAVMPMGMRPSSYVFERPISRFAERTLTAQVAGPTVGWIEDSLNTINRLIDGTLTNSDAHRVQRMIPFGNYWAISAALNKAIDNSVPAE